MAIPAAKPPVEPAPHNSEPESLLNSLIAQRVKHLPAMWETWVRSLCWEDLLEKEMASHSSILTWEISGTEEPGRLEPKELQKELDLAAKQQN